MKRTFLAMLLVGSCTTMFAQVNDSTNRGSNMGTNNSTNNSTMNKGTYNNQMSQNGTWNNSTVNSDVTTNTSTGSYNAYTATTNVPSWLQGSFTTSYPTAANVTWMQSPEWYRASFNNNGRMTHVYYHQNGSSYTVALPVLNSYVPDEVISKATSLHGNNIYAINSQRGMNGQDVYVVTLIENGQSRTEWMDANGMAVTDVYRMETTDANAGWNNNSNMNQSGTTGSDMNQSGTPANSMNSGHSTSGSTMDNSGTTDMNSGNKEKGSKLKIKTKGNEMKIKSETPDGKKKKTEIENGELKTRTKG